MKHINIFIFIGFIVISLNLVKCKSSSLPSLKLNSNFKSDLIYFLNNDIIFQEFLFNNDLYNQNRNNNFKFSVNKICYSSLWPLSYFENSNRIPINISEKYKLHEAGTSFTYFESSKHCIDFKTLPHKMKFESDIKFVNSSEYDKLYITFSEIFESDERFWIEVLFTNKKYISNFKALFIYDKKKLKLKHILRNSNDKSIREYPISYNGEFNFLRELDRIFETKYKTNKTKSKKLIKNKKKYNGEKLGDLNF